MAKQLFQFRPGQLAGEMVRPLLGYCLVRQFVYAQKGRHAAQKMILWTAQAVDEVQIAVQQAVAQLVIQAAANGDLHVGPLLVELPDGG